MVVERGFLPFHPVVVGLCRYPPPSRALSLFLGRDAVKLAGPLFLAASHFLTRTFLFHFLFLRLSSGLFVVFRDSVAL